MYQSEMKEGFIKDYMRSRVVARTSLYSLFRKTEPFEAKYDKDCSEFSQDEVLLMYTEFKAKSIYVLLNYNTILKAYCAWRQYYHKETTTESYKDINIELLKPCIPADSNKFLTREEITEIEDQLYNWTDKAILECLWEGISGPSMLDLVSIRDSIIDHKEKTLYFQDGRTVHLTDRLYDLLNSAFNESEYMCYGETLRVKKLIGIGNLYKERDNAYAANSNDKYFRWVYRKVQNYRDHVGIPGLTMKNIHISGLYHYLCIGLQESGLDLKSFWKSEQGEYLANKYGFHSDSYVDNLTHRFKDFV
jgi:integrase